MNRILVATMALAALGTTSYAADLPPARMPVKAEAPIPVATWTGC